MGNIPIKQCCIQAMNRYLHGEVDFRVVSITNTPITINNLKVTRLVPAIENPAYVLSAQTSNYNIYENKLAQKMLYIQIKQFLLLMMRT